MCVLVSRNEVHARVVQVGSTVSCHAAWLPSARNRHPLPQSATNICNAVVLPAATRTLWRHRHPHQCARATRTHLASACSTRVAHDADRTPRAPLDFNMATFYKDGDPACDAGNWATSQLPSSFKPSNLNISNWIEQGYQAVGVKSAILTGA